jgi:hypothetical protein
MLFDTMQPLKIKKMKSLLLLIFMAYAASLAYSQNDQKTADPDSVLVKSRVEFYMFDGPYGDKERLKEPAIKFILTVKNKGTKPIPDLQVSNRSEYVNFIIDGNNNNPVSMYNGMEAMGRHLLAKNASDEYIWWIFEKDAYGKVFTVQWQYMNLFSKKLKVNMATKSVEEVK